jgi:hypothetical protein
MILKAEEVCSYCAGEGIVASRDLVTIITLEQGPATVWRVWRAFCLRCSAGAELEVHAPLPKRVYMWPFPDINKPLACANDRV